MSAGLDDGIALEQLIEVKVAEALAREQAETKRTTMVVFSGEMDKLLAAFVLATGAAATGMEVSMFFTFWGLAGVRKKTRYKEKSVIERVLAAMLPSGPKDVGTSRMNFLGMGPVLFRSRMKKKNVQSLPEMVEMAREMGVRFVACEMSMDVMGIGRDEFIDGVEFGGVGSYLGDATRSRITLFV